jgi:hypothetical protein
MPDKLPFDKATRAEIVSAARAAMSGGLETTDFWKEFEREVSRISMEYRKPSVVPRQIAVDKTAPSGQ